MMIMETLKKLFVPSYTDKIVDRLNYDTQKEFKETSKIAKSHRDLLKKNGITFQIMSAAIGSRGDKHD